MSCSIATSEDIAHTVSGLMLAVARQWMTSTLHYITVIITSFYKAQ